MNNTEPALINLEQKMLYGLRRRSNDKTQQRDIPELCAKLYEKSGSKQVLPLYVVSNGYDQKTKNFELFVGGETDYHGADTMTLPAGIYAEVAVRPLLGFLWGAAIGKAKRWFYQVWLPESDFEAENLEYELHKEDRKVVLRFAIRRKKT